MTTSSITWTRDAGNLLTRIRRRRATPVDSSPALREQTQLRRENRKRVQDEAYRVALTQFWARR